MNLYKPKKGENLRNLTLFSTFLPFLAYISLFKSKKFHAGFLMTRRIVSYLTASHGAAEVCRAALLGCYVRFLCCPIPVGDEVSRYS